jgi:hypothetical protein
MYTSLMEILSIGDDTSKKRLLPEELKRYGVIFNVDEALKASGPSGISAPRQNLRDLLPASACINGNCLISSKAFEKCNDG